MFVILFITGDTWPKIYGVFKTKKDAHSSMIHMWEDHIIQLKAEGKKVESYDDFDGKIYGIKYVGEYQVCEIQNLKDSN